MNNIISKRVAGWGGVLGPLIAFVFITASILLHPWFNWADYALSHLGEVGIPYFMVYNIGLIATGIAGLFFTAGLKKLLDRLLGLSGVAVFGAGLVALISVGVFPASTYPHVFVSGAFFALCASGMLIIGLDQLRDQTTRKWGLFILFILFLAATSLILIGTIPYELGAAIPETVGAITFSEFTIVFGFRLLEYL